MMEKSIFTVFTAGCFFVASTLSQAATLGQQDSAETGSMLQKPAYLKAVISSSGLTEQARFELEQYGLSKIEEAFQAITDLSLSEDKIREFSTYMPDSLIDILQRVISIAQQDTTVEEKIAALVEAFQLENCINILIIWFVIELFLILFGGLFPPILAPLLGLISVVSNILFWVTVFCIVLAIVG